MKQIVAIILNALLIIIPLLFFIIKITRSEYIENDHKQHVVLSFSDSTTYKSNWLAHEFSFDDNGSTMDSSQIHIEDSNLVIEVNKNTSKGNKPYLGGELYTKKKYLYGKFSVQLKNELSKGVVSSFYLMNIWDPHNWNHKEIDIEFLGRYYNKVQFAVHHFSRDNKQHIYSEHLHDLGFNSNHEFHWYSILWQKDSISFFVDNKHVWTEKELLISDSMRIRINHWAGNQESNYIKQWLGPIETKTMPSRVFYKTIIYNEE